MLFHKLKFTSSTKISPYRVPFNYCTDARHRRGAIRRAPNPARQHGETCKSACQLQHREEILEEIYPEPALFAHPTQPISQWVMCISHRFSSHMFSLRRFCAVWIIYFYFLVLCRNISTSLSQEKRLEKLMEASKEVRYLQLPDNDWELLEVHLKHNSAQMTCP